MLATSAPHRVNLPDELRSSVADHIQRGERLTVTRSGRRVGQLVPVPRTALAAVALANGLDLYTCNPADFVGIGGVKVIAVPVP